MFYLMFTFYIIKKNKNNALEPVTTISDCQHK